MRKSIKSIGEYVEGLRERAGLTQKAAAERIWGDAEKQSLLSGIENGDIDPPWSTVDQIASELGYRIRLQFVPGPVQWLLDYSGWPPARRRAADNLVEFFRLSDTAFKRLTRFDDEERVRAWRAEFPKLLARRPDIGELVELAEDGFRWRDSVSAEERREIAEYIREHGPQVEGGRLHPAGR